MAGRWRSTPSLGARLRRLLPRRFRGHQRRPRSVRRRGPRRSRSSGTCPPRGCGCGPGAWRGCTRRRSPIWSRPPPTRRARRSCRRSGRTRSSRPMCSRSSTSEHQLEFLRERSDAAGRGRALAHGERRRRGPAARDRPGPPPPGPRPAAGRQAAKIKRTARLQPARRPAGMMNPDFVSVPERATVERGDRRRCARSEIPPEQLLTVVCASTTHGRLVGARRCHRSSMRAPTAQTPSAARSRTAGPAVSAEADVPEIARLMTDYNLISLPVVDGEGKPIGVLARRRRARADAARRTGAGATALARD